MITWTQTDLTRALLSALSGEHLDCGSDDVSCSTCLLGEAVTVAILHDRRRIGHVLSSGAITFDPGEAYRFESVGAAAAVGEECCRRMARAWLGGKWAWMIER